MPIQQQHPRAKPAVVILAGLPGVGKTHLCRQYEAEKVTMFGQGAVRTFSHDVALTADDGYYSFSHEKLEDARRIVLAEFLKFLINPGSAVLAVVDNLNIDAVSIAPYLESALALGFVANVLRIDPGDRALACWARNVHRVPLGAFLDMKRRWAASKMPRHWAVAHRLVEGV